MQITLQGRVNAPEQADTRRAELDAPIREFLPAWSLAPIVTALQALRGVASVIAVVPGPKVGSSSRFPSARELTGILACSRRALE
jgi:transposase